MDGQQLVEARSGLHDRVLIRGDPPLPLGKARIGLSGDEDLEGCFVGTLRKRIMQGVVTGAGRRVRGRHRRDLRQTGLEKIEEIPALSHRPVPERSRGCDALQDDASHAELGTLLATVAIVRRSLRSSAQISPRADPCAREIVGQCRFD